MKNFQQTTRGFSLIELLVTVSIISILLSLTAVGVQAAREAARRMKCSSNMRQVALAVQMFHNANNKLPALCTTYKRYDLVEKTDTGTEIGTCGAQIFLLPYLEQVQIYDGFEAFASSERVADSRPAHIIEPYPPTYPNVYVEGEHPKHWASGTVIPPFVCPSDGESGTVESPAKEYDNMIRSGFYFDYSIWSFSRRNTMFNMGDAPLFNCDIDTPASNRGAFTPHSWKSFSDITDGLSNTLCLAESITGRPADFEAAYNKTYPKISNALRDVAAVEVARDPVGMRVWPSLCMEAINSIDRLKLDKVEPWGERGTYWFIGKPLSNGFSTNLPPNSLTCSFGRSAHGPVLGGVSSFHPGGANTAMMDGSVRFIHDNIDTGDVFAPADRLLDTNQAVEGNSTYGVWGALGSINGGESVSL